MFREMRRTRQLLSKEETVEILNRCTSGVFAVIDEDGYPYTVPVSYVLKGEEIFFHSATAGHKIDSIKGDDKVTFCVIDKDTVVPEDFSTQYQSVVVFGRARILSDEKEIVEAMEAITQKYSPDYMEEGREEIKNSMPRFCVVAIEIEHMTGKAALSLVNQK